MLLPEEILRTRQKPGLMKAAAHMTNCLSHSPIQMQMLHSPSNGVLLDGEGVGNAHQAMFLYPLWKLAVEAHLNHHRS